MTKSFLYLLLIFAAAASHGCTPVQPWERQYLANRYMALDPDPLEAKSRQHVFFSKEGSTGGYGVGGGGCGCN